MQSLGRLFRVRRSAMSSIWPMSATDESISASAFPERPSCLLHKRCRLASSKAFSDRPSALHSANLHHAMSMHAEPCHRRRGGRGLGSDERSARLLKWPMNGCCAGDIWPLSNPVWIEGGGGQGDRREETSDRGEREVSGSTIDR